MKREWITNFYRNFCLASSRSFGFAVKGGTGSSTIFPLTLNDELFLWLARTHYFTKWLACNWLGYLIPGRNLARGKLLPASSVVVKKFLCLILLVSLLVHSSAGFLSNIFFFDKKYASLLRSKFFISNAIIAFFLLPFFQVTKENYIVHFSIITSICYCDKFC